MMYLGNNAIGLNHMITSIGSAARVESGTYTPESDELVSNVILTHSLGVIPDFIIVFINVDASEAYTASYLFFGSYYPSPTNNSNKYIYAIGYNQAGTASSGFTLGPINKDTVCTATTFTFPQSNSATDNKGKTLKANVTYHYVLGKFKEQEATTND